MRIRVKSFGVKAQTSKLRPAPIPDKTVKRRVLEMLKRCKGNIGKTATRLGVDPRTLRRHLRRYGIAPARRGPAPSKKRKG
jgi:transcriptional regulator of acetoin/glycerol metabolism